MTKHEKPWSQVQVGDYVAVEGKVWSVVDERQGWLKLRDRDGTHTAFKRPAPTELVEVREPTHDEALAVVGSTLGVTAHRESTSRSWAVDPFPRTARGIERGKSHIRMLHGVYVGDVKEFKELLECHDTLHVTPDDRMDDHTHRGEK